MGYSTSNPPRLWVGGVGGTPNLWAYKSTDAKATVNGADYFSNGDSLGMKVGDLVYVFDSATPTRTLHAVSAVTAGGAATVVFAAVS